MKNELISEIDIKNKWMEIVTKNSAPIIDLSEWALELARWVESVIAKKIEDNEHRTDKTGS